MNDHACGVAGHGRDIEANKAPDTRIAGAAHEAELHRALLPLAGAFKQWERGEHDSFTLQDLIHKFHQGAARDLYLRYASNGLEPALAHAIVTGALERTAVPTELLGHLAGLLEFYQDLLAESYDAGGPNEPA